MNKKFFVRIVTLFVMVVLIGAGIYIYRHRVISDPDYPAGSPGKEVLVDVPRGATGSEIAVLLLQKHVVESSAAFFRVAVGNPDSAKIAPGSHKLNQHIPAKTALAQLLDSARIANLIKIPEGAWTDEILTQMEKAGFHKADLLAALTKIVRPSGFVGNEGIFFPAQYSFGSKTSAQTALQSMVDRFGFEAKATGLDQGAVGFTPSQLLTMASIIQAEGDSQDFSKISQVIRNRLRIGMPLQMDTTVHYITRTRGQVFLSTDATKTVSDYNTYLHTGLPPGPIGNPGKAAIEAALHPETGPWIYFITVKPGDTRFTDSSSEFLTWKSEYEKNLAAGAFGGRS